MRKELIDELVAKRERDTQAQLKKLGLSSLKALLDCHVVIHVLIVSERFPEDGFVTLTGKPSVIEIMSNCIVFDFERGIKADVKTMAGETEYMKPFVWLPSEGELEIYQLIFQAEDCTWIAHCKCNRVGCDPVFGDVTEEIRVSVV